MRSNMASALARGLDIVAGARPLHGRKLAVVGAGPSLAGEVDALRSWDGDIWAANSAFGWLRDRGIDATFYAADPIPIIAEFAQGATRAILCAICDPSVFDAVGDATVFCPDMFDAPHPVPGCATAVGHAPWLALRLGYADVTFFGCEGSFRTETHVDRTHGADEVVIVECNGSVWATTPSLLAGSEHLACVLSDAPAIFKERSGGLLRALVADPDYVVRAMSPKLRAASTPQAKV